MSLRLVSGRSAVVAPLSDVRLAETFHLPVVLSTVNAHTARGRPSLS